MNTLFLLLDFAIIVYVFFFCDVIPTSRWRRVYMFSRYVQFDHCVNMLKKDIYEFLKTNIKKWNEYSTIILKVQLFSRNGAKLITTHTADDIYEVVKTMEKGEYVYISTTAGEWFSVSIYR